MKKFAYFMATVVGLFSSLFSHTAKAACDTYSNSDYEDPIVMSCGTNCCYRMSEDPDGNNEYIGMVYPDDEGEEAYFTEEVFSNFQMTDIYFSEGITKITNSTSGYGGTGNVHLPNSLKQVDEGALSASTVYIISDNIDTTNWSQTPFYNSNLAPDIFCVGDQDVCREKFANFQCSRWDDDTSDFVYFSCSDLIQPALEKYCTGSNYQWNNEKCEYIGGDNSNNTGGSSNQVSCGEGQLEKDNGCVPASQGCGEGYRQIETWCNKIRWTPAEAAQVLTNDNKNTVTITFRK